MDSKIYLPNFDARADCPKIIIGFFASLIFVGLELRQSHKIALAEQQQQRMDTFINIINNLTTNGYAHQVDKSTENKMTKRENIYHNLWHQ